MVSLKSFVFLAWISFGLGSVLYAVLATAYDRMIIFKEPIPDKALPEHVIATEQVPNEGSCRVKCYLEPNCVSINVGPRTKEQLTCELNDHTDKQILLKEEPGFTHYSIENICLDKRPCRGINALCQVGFSSSGYRCACVSGHAPDCRERLASSYWTEGGTSSFSDTNQWQQIDLISQYTIVTRVAVQGRKNESSKLVFTTYKLKYGDDGVNFQSYKNHTTDTTDKGQVFAGNTDQNNVVFHDLNPPIRARYIRFALTEWDHWIAMRVELYGCQNCVSGAGSWSGSNYVLFTKNETWNDARANCQRLGADLVKIESVQENGFIEMKFLNISRLDNVTYWIGLSDKANEGEWMWTDGSLITNTYSNWRKYRPINNNTHRNCAAIVRRIGNGHHNHTGWNDVRCQSKRGYICEMSQF